MITIYVAVSLFIVVLMFAILFGKASGETWKVIFGVAAIAWFFFAVVASLIYGGFLLFGG